MSIHSISVNITYIYIYTDYIYIYIYIHSTHTHTYIYIHFCRSRGSQDVFELLTFLGCVFLDPLTVRDLMAPRAKRWIVLLFGHPFLHFFGSETTDFLSCSIILFWQNDRDKRFFDWTTIEKWFLYYFSLCSAGSYIIVYFFYTFLGLRNTKKNVLYFPIEHWALVTGLAPLSDGYMMIYDYNWMNIVTSPKFMVLNYWSIFQFDVYQLYIIYIHIYIYMPK